MDDHGSLWDLASADLVAEKRSMRLTAAKVAVAPVWPFLALAATEAEFGHRLALADSHITAAVDADLRDEVLASLREDFRVTSGYGDGNWDDSGKADRDARDKAAVDKIMETKKYPDSPYRPYSSDDAMERHEQTNPAIFDPSGDKADRARRAAKDRDYGRFVFDDEHDDPNRERDGEDSDAGDRAWDRTKESSLAFTGSLWDNVDASVVRHQQRTGAWWNENGQQGATEDNSRHRKESALTFFHEASGKWVRLAAADESPGNPYYPDQTPESGPNTGQSGPFTTADPPDRTLDQYQNAMPGPWADRTPWVERPMQFAPPENGSSGWNLQRQTTTGAADPRYTDPHDSENPGTQQEELDRERANQLRRLKQKTTTGSRTASAENGTSDDFHDYNGRRPGPGEYDNRGGHESRPSPEDDAFGQGYGQAASDLYDGVGYQSRDRREPFRGHPLHGDFYHSGYEHRFAERRGSRQQRTAKAPPMDPQDEETRAHVCKHCGREEPDPTEPCRENGSYCSGCNGSGCPRCGHAGEVYGTHHLLVGSRRRAQVEQSPSSNPGYFDGSGGLTGDGADTAPPPIQGNPDAGVAEGGPDGGTVTSEPIGSRADWYENMTGQTDGADTGMGQATGGRRHSRYTVDDDDNVRGPNGDIKGHHDSDAEAREQQKALYANTKDAARSGFFDPHDASVRVVADSNVPEPNGIGGDGSASGADPTAAGGGDASAANTPQGGEGGAPPGQPNQNLMDVSTQAARRALAAGQPSSGGGAGGGGGGAPPPPQMQQGGPGAEAMPPMQQGAGAAGPAGGAAGNVPQSSKPAQKPGGGGGAPGGAGKPGGATSGAAPAGLPKGGRRVRADARDIATPDNPSGVGDEFMGDTFDKQMEQRPRQDGGARKVNTPQNPGSRDPIRTVDSPGTPGGGEDDDEEENTREAVRRSVARAMAGAR